MPSVARDWIREHAGDVRPIDEPATNGHGFTDEPPPHDHIPDHIANGEHGEHVEGDASVAPPVVNRFQLEMLDEIAVTDDPVELVQGLLPMGPALGVVFGPPKSLKSFLLTHVGLHIADNRPYCGRAVQGGAVVYVTSEGIRGVRRRLIAARRAMDIEGRNVPFALVSTMPNLGAGEGDRTALQKAIAAALETLGVPLRLIVLDTLRRAMPGKSENEQKDVSIVVDNCEALARAFGCLVIPAHHSPRSDDQRGSGSNALDAAADLMWSVIRDENRGGATATVVRYKDGEEGDTWAFELRPVDIATDRDGNPVTSCAVEVTTEPERKAATAVKKGHASPLALKYLDALLNVLAGEVVTQVRGRKAATTAAWRAECVERGLLDPEKADSARSLLSKNRAALVTANRVACEGDLTWAL